MRLKEAEKMAVAEQLRSGFPHPEPGVDEKKGKKNLMIRELFTPRSRRTENILVEMCDQVDRWEPPGQKVPKRRSRRRRRRGPKILFASKSFQPEIK